MMSVMQNQHIYQGGKLLLQVKGIPLQKWLILIFWWAQEYPVTDAEKAAEVDVGTAVDVYRWLREVCSTKLLGMSITLGGPGVVVQFDESLFRHKPMV